MAQTLTISADSVIYVNADITGPAGIIDDDIDAAVLPYSGELTSPASGDWSSGTWDGNIPAAPAVGTARALVGPGTQWTLTAGLRYQVWFRIHDNPEVPVLPAGLLSVI